MQAYQALLFSRIVPCVKDIGLWGPRVQKAYADMGVLDMAGIDLDALMRADEDLAEQVDAEKRELAKRRAGGGTAPPPALNRQRWAPPPPAPAGRGSPPAPRLGPPPQHPRHP